MVIAGVNVIKVFRINEVEFIHSLSVNGFVSSTCHFRAVQTPVYSSHTETFLPQTLRCPIKLAPYIHNT